MTTAANGKPILDLSDSIGHLESGGAWGPNGQGVTLSYSFDATAPGYTADQSQGFMQFTPAQIQAAQLALEAWSDVANITFVRVGSGTSGAAAYSNDGTIRLADYTSGESGAAAFTYLPGNPADTAPSAPDGDSWFNGSLSYNANPTVYGYGQQVLVHELGHALGLSHPSNYDAGGTSPLTYAADASFFQDSRQYSVMSYFSETNTGGYYGGYYASAPQLLDIATMQALYGPNESAFLGDTTYGFNSNSGRPWFTATSPTSPLIFTVWDAGGNDTFDFSGYSQAQTINLNQGQFSDVGGLTGNVAIAYGTVIENAIGGSGNDTILGNGADNSVLGMSGNDSIYSDAGNDYINGNKGNDTIDGGPGNNTLFGGQGDDSIIGGAGHDFLNGNIGNDTVTAGPNAGDSTLYGGQGADSIVGGPGNDVISGDLGNDILAGGPGANRFLFAPGGGHDWVTDFNSAQGDQIVLPVGTAYTVTTYQGQAMVDLSTGDTIGLVGVSPSQLSGNWIAYA